MRNIVSRVAAAGVFVIVSSACSNGFGTSLPYANAPNGSGGGNGTYQPGANSTALIRFVQGSPSYANVDVCVDNLPLDTASPSVGYGKASSLRAVSGGIAHTISTYPAGAAGASPGVECATAPGPYLGTSAIAITTFAPGTPGNPARETLVLGGTVASLTVGLYTFGEPSFAVPPAGSEAIAHNVAPAFSIGKVNGIGFGVCSTTVTPCTVAIALAGASGIGAPVKSTPTASVMNAPVVSALGSIPVGFYDGTGVAAGTPVPITSIAAPGVVPTQPYVQQLYAIDAPAGGLNLVDVPEQTTGFGI